MILGVSELLRLVKEKKLVENLSERELTNPEGAGFDFRIGALYKLKGQGYLGVTERETPDLEEIASFNPNKIYTAILKPRVYYVMQTIEKVNTPTDIVILFRPRSTLYRSGITLFTGNVAPGYNGELTFGMINFSDEPFTVQMGARVVHAMFYQTLGQTAMYRGQWQNGRAATKGKEKQV